MTKITGNKYMYYRNRNSVYTTFRQQNPHSSNFVYSPMRQGVAQFGVLDWTGKQLSRLGGATARTVSRAGKGMNNMGATMGENAIDAFNNKNFISPTGKYKSPNKLDSLMTDAKVRAGMLGMDAGDSMRRIGAFLNRNKAAVGAGVLGTGALAAGGAGYLGYNALNRPEYE